MSDLNFGLAARLVADIRTETARHTGCLEWDPRGIAAAMRACTGSYGSIVAAAALAAEDTSLRKPSEVGFRNHWPVNATTQRRASNTVPCGEHPDEPALGCERCKAERAQAVAAGVHLTGAALVHAELAKASTHPTPAQRRAAAQEATP